MSWDLSPTGVSPPAAEDLNPIDVDLQSNLCQITQIFGPPAPQRRIELPSPDRQSGRLTRCVQGQRAAVMNIQNERWNRPESNRPPPDCQPGALPDELRSQDRGGPEEPPIEVGVDHGPPIRLCGESCDGQR